MKIEHSDKQVQAHETKLSPAAEAAFIHNTRNFHLSAEEQNEVGRRVILAAEAAAKPSWWPAMQAAAAPTPEEAAELAEALAELAEAHKIVVAANDELRDAMKRTQAALREPADDWKARTGSAEVSIAVAQAAADAAQNTANIAREREAFVEGRVGRARGAIARNGARRQRQWAAGRI